MRRKTFDAGAYRKKAYSGQSSTNASGGYTIPSPLADYVKEMFTDATFIRSITPTLTLKAASLKLPVETGRPSAYVVNEGANIRSESGSDGGSDLLTKSTFGEVEFTVDKVGALVGWTSELAEDSVIDMGKFVVDRGILALAKSEESKAILGDSTGAIVSYAVGAPEVLNDGIVHQVPHSDNSTNGGLWTPANTSADNIIAGGSDLLTVNEIAKLTSKLYSAGTNFREDVIVVSPNVSSRMLDSIEFEPFQTIDKIGSKAANIAGYVGNIYNRKVIVSDYIPQGGQTSPATMTGNFVTSDTDTIVLGFNSKEYARFIKRRDLEIRNEHDFNTDSEKVRFLERIGWHSYRPELTAMIHNVKNDL